MCYFFSVIALADPVFTPYFASYTFDSDFCCACDNDMVATIVAVIIKMFILRMFRIGVF